MKCLGCDRDIPWDGEGLFAYTCPCGATVFYDEKGLAVPASLVRALYEGRPLPHIDYYVGISDHMSEIKKEFIAELRRRGAVWSWECGECREKFLKRKRMEREMGLLRFGLHPALEKEVSR